MCVIRFTFIIVFPPPSYKMMIRRGPIDELENSDLFIEDPLAHHTGRFLCCVICAYTLVDENDLVNDCITVPVGGFDFQLSHETGLAP